MGKGEGDADPGKDDVASRDRSGSYGGVLQILLPAIVGGIGTIWGPVVGSLIISVLGQGSTALVRSPPPFLEALQGVSGLDVAIYGTLIVLVVLFLPRGVFGTLRERLATA